MELEKYIQQANLTLGDLVQKTGISEAIVQGYIREPNSLVKAPGETLYKLSLVLDCTVEDLVIGSIVPEPTVGQSRGSCLTGVKYVFNQLSNTTVYCKEVQGYSYLIFVYKGKVVVLPFEAYIAKGEEDKQESLCELMVRRKMQLLDFEDKYGRWEE